MSRTGEFVLGLLGGIFGFGTAIFVMFIGAVDEAVSGSQSIYVQGTFAFIASILAIVTAITVKFKPKLSGLLMALSGVVLFVTGGLFGVLPGLLLLGGGLMGILRKEPANDAGKKTA